MRQLPAKDYTVIRSMLEKVKIHHIFANSVLDGRVNGFVCTDSIETPKVFYIKHPCGMSLVFGDQGALRSWKAFWAWVNSYSQTEDKDEWLQAWPEALSEQIERQLNLVRRHESATCEKHARVNYKFDRSKFLKRQNCNRNSSTFTIVRTGGKEFDELRGSVIPSDYWSDRDSFLNEGIGFSLIAQGVAVSTAFSAFVHDQMLELGVETQRDYQGRGFAFEVCCHLVKYCLEKKYEPAWSCRIGNRGSARLAEKIGFSAIDVIPYYRLKGSVTPKNAGNHRE